MYKHTRKEGLDYMEDRDKMNGNGMEKGIIGQDSQLRGGGGLLEDLAAGLECLYLSDLRYGYCQSALRFVLPQLDPERYSVEEWNRAAGYIMALPAPSQDSQVLHGSFLLRFHTAA